MPTRSQMFPKLLCLTVAAAVSLLASVREDLAAISEEENHPLRASFDTWFSSRIKDLPDNQSLSSFLEKSVAEALQSDAAVQGTAAVLRRLREWFLEDLGREDSALLFHAGTWLDEGLARLESDGESQRAFDLWIKERIARAVESHHGEIGAIVRHNLDKLDDTQLVEQIESRVGPDLQYIRVNGAVVGGLVGAGLYLLKVALGS